MSKSAAGRIIDSLGPMLALQSRARFAYKPVLIIGGTLVPTRDHTVGEQSKGSPTVSLTEFHEATRPSCTVKHGNG